VPWDVIAKLSFTELSCHWYFWTVFGKEELTDAKAAIVAANNGYVRAIVAGDLDTLMTFYI
jgi:hypothetical protein